MLGWLSTDFGRNFNAYVALAVLFAWTINGVVTADRRDGLDNVITGLLGAMFFGLAAGSWSAAHDQNAAWRVGYFSAFLSVLLLALAWRLASHVRKP